MAVTGANMNRIWQQVLDRPKVKSHKSIEFTVNELAGARNQSGPLKNVPCTDLVLSRELWVTLSTDAEWVDYLHSTAPYKDDGSEPIASLFGMQVWTPPLDPNNPESYKLVQLPELMFIDGEGTIYCYNVRRSRMTSDSTQHSTRAQIVPSHVDLDKAYKTLKEALANRSDRIQAEQALTRLDQVLDCLNSTDISL